MQPGAKIGTVSWYEPEKGAIITELASEDEAGSEVKSHAQEVFVRRSLLTNIRLTRGQLVQYFIDDEDESIAVKINPLHTYLSKTSP